MSNSAPPLKGDNDEFGKGSGVDRGIKPQQALSMVCGVSADEKIGQNAARCWAVFSFSPGCIRLEGETGEAPDVGRHFEIDHHASFSKKPVHEICVAARGGDELA